METKAPPRRVRHRLHTISEAGEERKIRAEGNEKWERKEGELVDTEEKSQRDEEVESKWFDAESQIAQQGKLEKVKGIYVYQQTQTK